MKKIKIVIDENNRLLGYCDIGEIPNSIEIEVEDNFIFKKDIQNYRYTGEKLEYKEELELERLKKKKREEFKKIRDGKIYENIELEGSMFQVREKDLQKFFLKKIEADLNPELKEKKEDWILANNTMKAINFNDIEKILKAFGERQRELFKKFSILSMQLEKANTIEEIKTIEWEF